MTDKTKDNVFKQTSQMLHTVASNEYNDCELYHTSNGREWFYKDNYFRDDVLVGKVLRDSECILVNSTFESYCGSMSSMYWCTRALKDAFKHYKVVSLTAFNKEEAETIFKKALLDVENRKTYKRMKAFILAAESYKYFGGSTQGYLDELLSLCHTKVDKADEEKRIKKEEEERRRQEYDDKCYELAKKHFIDVAGHTRDISKILTYFLHKRDYNWYSTFCKISISKKEWQEAYDLWYNQYYNRYLDVNKTWNEDLSKYVCPPDPTLRLECAFVSRYIDSILGITRDHGEYYDYLTIIDNNFVTTRGVVVKDDTHLVKKLLKKFVACKTDKARQKFVGFHVGSFEIREWNSEGQYLQVGCHRFHLKALEQLASTLK